MSDHRQPVRRALLSVSDKTGLLPLAQALAAKGVVLLSTGGTAKALREAGLDVTDVSSVTGFPEIMDGRVKTLHPTVHGGLLGRTGTDDAVMAQHGIEAIDLLVVNLYPFEATVAKPDCTYEDAVENIDIGGPAMLRAAAKNHARVAVLTDPADYDGFLEALAAGGTTGAQRRGYAAKGYAHTARYDGKVSMWLSARVEDEAQAAEWPSTLNLQLDLASKLRYGENPHQRGALYVERGAPMGIVATAQFLQGKELSYNNLVDLDAAWQLVAEFDLPASAIIKHTNPCGCATAATLADSYRQAFAADPISAFGGVLAFNRELDADTAAEIAKTFIEAIAAPSYSPEALSLLAAKKNLRLLAVAPGGLDEPVVKTITGGYLVQSADRTPLFRAEARVATTLARTAEQWDALEFAWRVVKHVKSNAIVYARPGQLIAAGAGQMSRVDSVKFGAAKAILPLDGCVVASDAFFPFPDGLEASASHGARAFIQPGGSVKDEEVIAAANRLGVAMVLTGFRHFRH